MEKRHIHHLLLPGLLLAIAALFPGCGPSAPKNKAKTVPTSYRFVLNATFAYPSLYLKVEKEDKGGSTLLYFSDGGFDIQIFKAPKDLLPKIGQMANDYGLSKLDSHYRPTLKVLDGMSWNLSVSYPSPTPSIYSSGENQWPGGDLRKGINEINRMLRDLAEGGTLEVVGSTDHSKEREY